MLQKYVQIERRRIRKIYRNDIMDRWQHPLFYFFEPEDNDRDSHHPLACNWGSFEKKEGTRYEKQF